MTVGRGKEKAHKFRGHNGDKDLDAGAPSRTGPHGLLEEVKRLNCQVSSGPAIYTRVLITTSRHGRPGRAWRSARCARGAQAWAGRAGPIIGSPSFLMGLGVFNFNSSIEALSCKRYLPPVPWVTRPDRTLALERPRSLQDITMPSRNSSVIAVGHVFLLTYPNL